ncbi:MAG TPA: MMPL family transporter, partial [Gaiellales bacterium]|nr:MMPL family transporter [Gaiellales bacterium]
MTDRSANGSRVGEERRIAYSGALARWAGRCARHPWRVIGSWLVIFVSLIVLNIAFHGTLVNDFNIPGSDVQKATDLINAKFGGQKGSALRVVVAAPKGQSLDSPEAKAAIAKMLAASKQSQKSLDTVKSDVSAITSPLASAGAHQLAKDGRIGYFDVQFDQTGFELPRSGVVDLENTLRDIGAPVGLQVEFTGDAESAPPTQGLSDIIGLIAAFIILIVLFRALVPTVIPLLFAITAVITAFLLLYLAAAVWHFNT